jgi:flagellar motor switch protein FliM
MDVSAEIRGTSLMLADVLQLQVGDMITLSKKYDDFLDLTVDGIPRMKGLVAINAHQKRVFQVTKGPEEY